MKRLNLIGHTYVKMKVISFHSTNKRGVGFWNCICSCGKKCIRACIAMRNSHTKSCGCLKNKGGNIKHGHSKYRNETPFYRIWGRMLRRCRNKNSKDYLRYGAKGIFVCKEWKDFRVFLKDMYPSFLKHQKILKKKEISTIDRIDNALGYSKQNCRWLTMYEQNRNRTSNINVLYKGKKMCLKDFSSCVNLDYHKIYSCYRKGKLQSFFKVSFI